MRYWHCHTCRSRRRNVHRASVLRYCLIGWGIGALLTAGFLWPFVVVR